MVSSLQEMREQGIGLILCLKIFKLSEIFISFAKFPHRTFQIILIIRKPNLFVLIFLLITGVPDPKL